MSTTLQDFNHILCGPDFEYCGVPEFLRTTPVQPASPIIQSPPYLPSGVVHGALLVGVFCWPAKLVWARNAHITVLAVLIPLGPLTVITYIEWVFAMALFMAVWLGHREDLREASRIHVS